jgi:hypothetical protein
VSAAADDDFRDVHHTVRIMHMDLDSGVVQEIPAGEPVATFPDAAAREARAGALKAAE